LVSWDFFLSSASSEFYRERIVFSLMLVDSESIKNMFELTSSIVNLEENKGGSYFSSFFFVII